MLLNNHRINMIEEFISNTNVKITASQIAKKQKLNQKTTYLFMEELEQKAIIKSEIQGKNKLYYLNKENKEIIKQFLCTIEHIRTLNFYRKNPKIKLITEKLLPHIQGIAIIFGSYAKNTQKETSDLDLFIVGNYKEKEVKSIIKTYNLEINIKNQKKFEKNHLTTEIIKNHIIIKKTEEFVEAVLD